MLDDADFISYCGVVVVQGVKVFSKICFVIWSLSIVVSWN